LTEDKLKVGSKKVASGTTTKSVEYTQDAARLEGKYNCPSIIYKRGDEEKVTNYTLQISRYNVWRIK